MAAMCQKLTKKDEEIAKKDEEIAKKDEEIAKKEEEMARKDEEMARKMAKKEEVQKWKEEAQNLKAQLQSQQETVQPPPFKNVLYHYNYCAASTVNKFISAHINQMLSVQRGAKMTGHYKTWTLESGLFYPL